MTNLELLDRLCSVVEEQAKIIREQAFFIENMTGIDEETKKKYADLRQPHKNEFSALEPFVGPFRSENCGKEITT